MLNPLVKKLNIHFQCFDCVSMKDSQNILTLTRDTHLMQQFIYYYKQLYMFRASICPSSGVLGCIRVILLHMVSSTIKGNCALVGCRNVLYVYIGYTTYNSEQDYTPAPHNLSHNT